MIFVLTAVVLHVSRRIRNLQRWCWCWSRLASTCLLTLLAGQCGAVVMGRFVPGWREGCMRWGGQLLRALGYAFSAYSCGYLRRLGMPGNPVVQRLLPVYAAGAVPLCRLRSVQVRLTKRLRNRQYVVADAWSWHVASVRSAY